MTTTTTWTTTYDYGRFGLALVIEGLNVACCTGMSTSEAATAWAGTPWADTTWRGGLRIVGSMGQKIELFDPKIDHDSLTFEVVDLANALIGIVARPLSTAGAKTYLSANVDEDDTSVTAISTSAFAASGTIYVGTETMHYSSLSAPSFMNVTRGKFQLDLTNGGSDFAKAHRKDPITNVKPTISDYPRRHYNRRMWLYLHHKEMGTWSTKGNALLLWTGSLKGVSDDGTGTLRFEGTNVKERLRGTLLVNQFRGDLAQGLYLTATMNGIAFREMVAGVWQSEITGTFGGTGAMRTWGEFETYIMDFLQANRASLTFDWHIRWKHPEKTLVIEGLVATPAASGAQLLLHPDVWKMLGWDLSSGDAEDRTISGTTYHLWRKEVSGYDRLTFGAPAQALVYYYKYGLFSGADLRLNDTEGIWASQPVIPTLSPTLPSATDGFLQVGDKTICAVDRTNDTTWTITADVSKELIDENGITEYVPILVRTGDYSGPVPVKQVWFERDEARDVFLRLLLSTGTQNYNHATYDKNGYGMGLGIPASLVDINSFELMGTEQYQLLITKPSPVLTYLESALAFRGLYLILKSGKFTLRQPRFDGQNISAAWNLTEANKAKPDEKTRITYAADGIINRIEARYNQRVGGEWRRSITVEDLVSITDFGQRRTVQLDGHGIMREEDAEAWKNVAATALAYFSREIAIIERSYDLSLSAMVPGDTVLIDDNYLVDPRAGTRGVTDYPGWVLEATFNWSTIEGACRIACLPDLDYTRIGAWAPAARVDETATNGGYVVATKTLTLKANAYSVSGGTTDTARFAGGDLITVREVSATAGLSWNDTVEDLPAANQITVTDGLAGWDSTKQYIVEFRVKTAVVTGQKDVSFIADDATNSTGDATDDAYHWGGLPDVDYSPPSLVYPNRYYQVPTTIDDTAAPLTVADYYDLLQGLNGLLAYGTRYMTSDFLTTNATVTGTTKTRLWGPVWIPCMGYNRNLLVRLYGRSSSGEGTFTITTTPTLPYGTADNAMVVTPDATEITTTATTSSATDEWLSEKSIAVAPQLDEDTEGPLGVWVMVEGAASAGGATLTLAGITVAEDNLV